ncbi:MAG: class I SAM-dependent methyltransferase [Planctomycetota bacterium]
MAEWARRSPGNTAEGYDIDPDPVEWGKARNFEGIEDPFARVHFHLEDVREPSRRAPEVRTAPNFSWMIFTDRATLLDYFRAVREDLADDGVYILDIYGGTEAAEEMEEIRKIPEGFEYVWDQVAYWPATGDYLCRIHFRFKDGTRIKKAFEYHWRLWNLPEVVDVLRDAGFSQVDSYWEGTDEDGVSGDGVFKKHAKGENCPAWVTYVVAQK